MQNIRAKIKRKLSMHDKHPDLDAEDVDEETTDHLHREIEAAEVDGDKNPYGKPGSFLNRLIMHGNKKTEEEMVREAAADEQKQVAGGSGATAASASVAGTKDKKKK